MRPPKTISIVYLEIQNNLQATNCEIKFRLIINNYDLNYEEELDTLSVLLVFKLVNEFYIFIQVLLFEFYWNIRKVLFEHFSHLVVVYKHIK